MAREVLKSLIPAINLGTLRSSRKGDPQHKCCGNKNSGHAQSPRAAVVTQSVGLGPPVRDHQVNKWPCFGKPESKDKYAVGHERRLKAEAIKIVRGQYRRLEAEAIKIVRPRRRGSSGQYRRLEADAIKIMRPRRGSSPGQYRRAEAEAMKIVRPRRGAAQGNTEGQRQRLYKTGARGRCSRRTEQRRSRRRKEGRKEGWKEGRKEGRRTKD